MPSMPAMPSLASSSDDSSFTEGVANAAPEVDLDVPSHNDEDFAFKKPELIGADSNDHSQVRARIVPKQGIEVEATRKGFYNQMRHKEGDRFFVKNREELGEWMKCVDSLEEKARVEFFKNKKVKAKA